MLKEFQQLLGNISQVEVAKRLGVTQPYVSVMRALLLLPVETQKQVDAGRIPIILGSALSRVKGDAHRRAVADIVSGKITKYKELVKKYEEYIENHQGEQGLPSRAPPTKRRARRVKYEEPRPSHRTER